jgi:starch phosphorylase
MTTTTLNGRTEYFKEQFDHHLRRSLAVIGLDGATQYERYLAIAYTVRDELIDRWAKTQKSYYDNNVKRVYYLSLEFLMGRTLGNAILNLNIEDEISDALNKLGIELEDLREAEVDAGLGNGGLGRLAACFIDSMATLEIPAYGMGIRYEYVMFNQQI